MHELATTVTTVLGSASPVITLSAPYPTGYDDVQHRRPDLTKARALIDYAPRFQLPDTIQAIAASIPQEAMA